MLKLVKTAVALSLYILLLIYAKCSECGVSHWPSNCPYGDDGLGDEKGNNDWGTAEEWKDIREKVDQMNRLPACPSCKGTGDVNCSDCNPGGTNSTGFKRVIRRRPGTNKTYEQVERCPGQCNSGKVQCPRCNGTGRLGAKEVIDR